MFGTIVYRNPEASYAEYLLADERGVRVIACMVASHPKLYRIEWPDEEDSTYIHNTAVYSLIDAMEVFEEKVERLAESDLDAQDEPEYDAPHCPQCGHLYAYGNRSHLCDECAESARTSGPRSIDWSKIFE